MAGRGLALLLGLALFDCRQVIGIDDPHALSACASCSVTSCAAERDACGADSLCAAAFACFDGCGVDDDACLVGCAAKNPFSKPIATYAACRAQRCEAPCAGTCGGLFPRFLPRLVAATRPASTECLACLRRNTCAEATACGKSAPCTYDFACREAGSPLVAPALDLPNGEACDRTACHDACQAGDTACNARCDQTFFPASLAPRAALDDKLASCSSECGFGAQWSCLGKVKPRRTHLTAGKISYYVRVYESEGATTTIDVLPDATVKVCDGAATTCDAPKSQSKSNESGFALVEIPAADDGFSFRGYLETRTEKAGYLLPTLTVNPLPLFDGVNPIKGKTEIAVLKPAAADLLAGHGLIPQFETTGHLMATSFDCELSAAPHVVFHWENLDPALAKLDQDNLGSGRAAAGHFDATGRWVTGKSESFTETVVLDKVGADSGMAMGGFQYLQPGLGKLTARLTDGRLITEINAPVHQKALTIVFVVPIP